MALAMDPRVARRTSILANHFECLQQNGENGGAYLVSSPCSEFIPPELGAGQPKFSIFAMRELLDGHDVEARNSIANLMESNELFQLKRIGRRIFVGVDYNQPMEVQRDLTMRRILYLLNKGVFRGWLTDDSTEAAWRRTAVHEYLGLYDHSLGIKLGVHFHLWGGAVQFLGTKRHHDKWLKPTEEYIVKGCFAMSELGHGSNVRGIETIAVYDPPTKEFIINTPCESAQKYWIGGAAQHATHAIIFAQLHMAGKNQGVHAFIAQIRDENGKACSGTRIADCGHKIGLNGVDNGRIWFDNIRVPRENLLNSVADVTPEGHYVSSISDPDQRFGAFMAPLTSGRVTIAVSAVYQAKLGLATAIRYALTRRAFSRVVNGPEVLLLDYPSHQRRLFPLLAVTYGISFAAMDLKKLYINRRAEDAKTIHILSSGYKAVFSWHNIRTLQECREACGGQGLKTDNKVGQFKAEYDVQLTFEGDNNVLMQQVSKGLLSEYLTSKKKGKPLRGLGLEHINGDRPMVSTHDTTRFREKGFQMALFRLRERDLLERYAQECTKLTKDGLSSLDASLLSYQLGEDLARAFSERAVLEAFLNVEDSQLSPLKDILGLLRTLFVLSIADENPVFLRYGYLSSEQSRKIQKEIVSLCAEIRPHALSLVDSFGIPSTFLGPIAFDWVAANSWEVEASENQHATYEIHDHN